MDDLDNDPVFQAMRWALDLIEDHERETVRQLLEASGQQLDEQTGQWHQKRQTAATGEIKRG